jgi:hypothetical protein
MTRDRIAGGIQQSGIIKITVDLEDEIRVELAKCTGEPLPAVGDVRERERRVGHATALRWVLERAGLHS